MCGLIKKLLKCSAAQIRLSGRARVVPDNLGSTFVYMLMT